jgi:DNA-binding transcriptional regulator GbsR (MarR family)
VESRFETIIHHRQGPALTAAYNSDISVLTEMTEQNSQTELTAVQEKFILHWGEMGTRWGINRTVAQIHALLFLSPVPLHAEAIATTLGIARSNVSTSLRELQGWGIVRVTHILGDRRDHFESLKDVWEMFRIIVDERKKREADPTLAMLREAVIETKKPGAADAYTRERLADMLQFFELMTSWCEQTRKLPTPAVIRMVKMGNKVARMLGE